MIYFRKPRILFMKDGDGEGGGNGGDGGQDGGNQAPEWAKDLPEDIRGWDEVIQAETPDSFYEHLRNQRSFMGQSIRIPGPDAGTEDIKAFHGKLVEKVPGLIPAPNPDDPDSTMAVLRALGTPENADGYGDIEIKVPTGVKVDKAPIDAFRAIAHKHGLTKKQFEGVVNDMSTSNIEAAATRQSERDTDIAALNTEWGAAFKERSDRAALVAEKTNAPPDLIAAIQNGQASASTLKWLYNLGTLFKGEPNIGGDKNTNNTLTPEEAQVQADEIMNNHDHPYWKADHPGHKAAIQKMVKLRALINPE